MPSTPIFGFRYPASSQAPNVPVDIQNLATDVETKVNTILPDREGNLQAALGVKAWTLDPHQCSTTTAKSSGVIHGGAVYFFAGSVVTSVAVFVTAGGTGMTHYFVGVADSLGKTLATSADVPTTVQSQGWKSINLTSPWTCPANGLYYLIELGNSGAGNFNTTTNMPSLLSASFTGGTSNRGVFPNGKLYWYFDSSQDWQAFPSIGTAPPSLQGSSNDHCLVAF